MKLIDALPWEFSQEFTDTKAWSIRNVEVVEERDGCVHPWIGKHKNVYNWFILENGYAIGWNENPSRGWSFCVEKYKEKEIL